ncbi:MAG: peptide chain release factor N(5)-glutamine methyltransferase [Deltaproteobacteria bacterium]|nr:peptide chain release factor N(5)-glutamine methyltransferase [Deltaproteobacteria bacterium]
MSNQSSPWTILKLLSWTASFFRDHCIDSPRLTAEILLSRAMGLERIDLYLKYDQPLLSGELAKFKQMIKRRANREPVAYITGEKEFFGRGFFVSPQVLIPRPETEILVETALGLLDENPVCPMRVLDAGTGSGAIIVSLSLARPGYQYQASDISMAALAVAAANAGRHGVKEKINFFAGDWLTPIAHGFKACLIVSNPPYIPSGDIPTLEPEVRAHEPSRALDGALDGLFAIRQIMDRAPHCLADGGHLLLEIGHDQKEEVARLARESGRFAEISFVRDLAGIERVAVLRKAACRSVSCIPPSS